MTRRRKRMLLVLFLAIGVGSATTLALAAFRKNMMYFYSPTQVAAGAAARARSFRLGGLVQKGSIRKSENGLTTRFVVTDHSHGIPVTYTGILPDLFRSGQGVVVHGHLGVKGTFRADRVLAKHNATYMPASVKRALKKTALATTPSTPRS